MINPNWQPFDEEGISARQAQLETLVFKRTNWTCQVCGAKDKWLELHIIDWNLGENVEDFGPDDLFSVCTDCFDKPLEF